jgi:II/X family phage/plasmid replication protein
MIDTVRLASSPVSEATIKQVEQFMERRSCVHLGTGELSYEFTSGGLLGSWDSRVSVQVEREEWTHVVTAGMIMNTSSGSRVRGCTSKVACEPYLVIEGSIHKAMLGHNVYGGPIDFPSSCAWFVGELARRMGVELPSVALWRVLRADWAECFDLGSFEAVQEFIGGLNSAEFPRRTVVRHGSESLYAPGRTTTVKAYHKGVEFSAHDWKRLKHHLDHAELVMLQERANCILRLETSIKAKKLVDDFKGIKPPVVEVTQGYLERVHDREVARLLKEGKTAMDTVRTHKEVSRRLHETYSENTQLANLLFGTWLQLATLGESEVKVNMSPRTYYRQRKQLSDAGVSWQTTDVYVSKHSAIPAGFSPVRQDPRRLTDESMEVCSMLRPYQKFA